MEKLALQLEAAGATDGRSAVLVAALNLLDEFLQKIPAESEQERIWRLEVLADLAEARKLSLGE
jgi:hypothetical protein